MCCSHPRHLFATGLSVVPVTCGWNDEESEAMASPTTADRRGIVRGPPLRPILPGKQMERTTDMRARNLVASALACLTVGTAGGCSSSPTAINQRPVFDECDPFVIVDCGGGGGGGGGGSQLTVTISGPSSVSTPGTKQWTAVPSGLNPPFTYAWSVHWHTTGQVTHPSTSQTLSLNVSASVGCFTVEVTVTKGGASDDSAKFVNNLIPGSPDCPF